MTMNENTGTQDTIDFVELTARLGLAPDKADAVLSWTGEDAGYEWTIAEADELAGVWAADVERIAAEG